jgi:hypothetical protein
MVVLRDSHVDAVSRRKDFSGVVIYAQPVGAPPPSEQASHATSHATMLQKGKTFTPHILPDRGRKHRRFSQCRPDLP